ncbi:MAG: hypothetical protein H7A51_08700 [Akkermansiaceae bacterium]|nr:hypothetical protein [Akkermansiaceae bacterium]
MSFDAPDPYQSPSVDPHPVLLPNPETAPDGEKSAVAPPVVVEHLRCTRPWVKFCSIAGYITSLFLVLIAFLTLRGMLGRFSFRYLVLLGSFYLILAILFVIPSLWLSKYEKSITRLEVSHRIEDLEQAIAHQRAFWRNMAIVILIMLLIYLLTIAFSAIVIISNR